MQTYTPYIILVLVILLIVSGIAIRNLLHKHDALIQDIITHRKKIDSVEDETIKYHKYFLKLFNQTYQELQRVDKRGSFSSDDEVGFAFRVIINAIETTKNKLQSLEVEEEEEEGYSEKTTQ